MSAINQKILKQSQLKSSKVTLKQSFLGTCTNIIYKLGAIGGIPQILKTNSEPKSVTILGQEITSRKLAELILNKIVWFTYREKIKIAEDLNSDVGWGCLPRVGQMVMAQALLKYFMLEGQTLNEQLYKRIIESFIDDIQQSSCYSLNVILKYARWKFAISPGQWFNIGQLSQVLRKIQQQKPMEGSQRLKILFFNQSVIFLNQIEKKAGMKLCKCLKKVYLCPQCNRSSKKIEGQKKKVEKQRPQTTGHNQYQKQKNQPQFTMTIQQYNSDERQVDLQTEKQNIHKIEPLPQSVKQWQIYDKQNEQQWNNQVSNNRCSEQENQGKIEKQEVSGELQNHILLIVSIRIAEKTIQKFDYDSILSLLSLPSSLGIIGGVPNKALYIVGCEDKEVIYLDPHYVQQYIDKKNYTNHLQTFFCNQYRTINIKQLDPSMAFCFYMQTIADVQSLLQKINHLKQRYKKNDKHFFITIMDSNIQEFEGECKKIDSNQSPQNEYRRSFQYSSLQFRDLSDSL